MATVTFQKPRPRCLICGTQSHVITVANAKSPYLGCCAVCGQATAQLLEMLKYCDGEKLRRLLSRARQINQGRLPLPAAETAAG